MAAGRPRPGDPAARQRGPLPAAARPRRGAPVRDHLPAAAARQADGREHARRRPRARRGPQEGAAAPVRLAQAAARGVRGGDRERSRDGPDHGAGRGRRPRRVRAGPGGQRDAPARSSTERPLAGPDPAALRTVAVPAMCEARTAPMPTSGTEPGGRGIARAGPGQRHVRRRAVDRGPRAGGPGLVRHRQPAALAAAAGGRARSRSVGHRTAGRRGRRPGRPRSSPTSRGRWRRCSSTGSTSRGLPRGRRRRARPPLREQPAAAPAAGRRAASSTASSASGSCSATCARAPTS